ncbi:hypothetical protein [uncultured Tenacibaculum sp.]|uniref:hypothetical protein n=1 Tax=uncultured Tenacibaculum sp. TaxID=174713 RepID=UPI0026232C82|nr:hypothetical protein [uncultured Tenacibaculum sp.]
MKESVVLYDEVLKLNVCDLKKWGYFNNAEVNKGIISWHKREKMTGSIHIESFSNQFIKLNYFYKKEQVNLKVFLTCLPSNLGKGVVYYFLCPKTNKKCRKLYLINGKFVHREAFKGILYESQTYSKKMRIFKNEFEDFYKLDYYYSELHQKHFKRFYKGAETKRYKKLLKSIQSGESTSLDRLNTFY